MPSIGSLAPADAPPEITSVMQQVDGARRRALDRVGVGKLLGKGKQTRTAAVAVPFADSGRPRELAAVRRALRRVLRTSSEPARVQAWHGVAVAGDRAVVRADVQRLVKLASGRRIAHPPERLTFGLARGSDGWQVVTGR